MLNKNDFENHLKIHRGYLTEEFISQLTGINKFELIHTANRWIKKELIECKNTSSVKVEKNNTVKESIENCYNLLDTIILLGKYRKTTSIIHAIKLCKKLIIENNKVKNDRYENIFQ